MEICFILNFILPCCILFYIDIIDLILARAKFCFVIDLVVYYFIILARLAMTWFCVGNLELRRRVLHIV